MFLVCWTAKTSLVLLQVSDLAASLQRNVEEDYRVYHRIAAAGRRGVRFTLPAM